MYVLPTELKIKCKGGKWLTREITPAIREIINSKEFKKHLNGNKWESVKDASINRYLNRVQDELGLDRHSFQDIRRRVAQNFYDKCRKEGMSRSDAIDKTAEWLNHNAGRGDMLRKSYIKPW